MTGVGNWGALLELRDTGRNNPGMINWGITNHLVEFAGISCVEFRHCNEHEKEDKMDKGDSN